MALSEQPTPSQPETDVPQHVLVARCPNDQTALELRRNDPDLFLICTKCLSSWTFDEPTDMLAISPDGDGPAFPAWVPFA